MKEERFVLTDDVWLRLAPHLPGKQGDAGVTGKDNRLFLEAVPWRERTGLPWRDLPPDFGNWNSVFRRFRRWAEIGVWSSLGMMVPTNVLRPLPVHGVRTDSGRNRRQGAAPSCL